MEVLASWILSVVAGVISHYICKWLDGNKLISVTYLG